MAGQIPDAFIQDLLTRTDIIDVISPRVPLKRSGREYGACCPFHNEKTPSFTVSPQKQFYHCFGCGAHGSAIGFLMEYEGLEFVDAIEELAQLNGLEVPREAHSGPRIDAGQYEIMQFAADYFRQSLSQHSGAKSYLQQRGLDAETLQEFGVGWAPDSWDGLIQYLTRKNIDSKKLEKLGLVSAKGERIYDRFRDRVMFPIADRRGRVIAFGGRIISKEGTAKYLNSPETDLFHKGHVLFNLARARAGAAKVDRLVVVEGYMDVVSLWQHGIKNAVATLGTATTPEHAELLFRAAPEVVFCFDGDRAGRDAAWKALINVLPKMRDGRMASFLFLPDGEDPDTIVRQEGAQAFESRYKSASSLEDFLFDSLAKELDMNRLDQRARFAEKAKEHLQKLPDSIFRDLMYQALAQRAKLPENAVHAIAVNKEPSKRVMQVDEKTLATPARAAIAVSIQFPHIARIHSTSLNSKLSFGHGELLYMEVRAAILLNPDIVLAGILHSFKDHSSLRFLEKLSQAQLLGDDEELTNFLQDSVFRMEKDLVKVNLDSLDKDIQESGFDEEKKRKFTWLHEYKLEIDQKLLQRQLG